MWRWIVRLPLVRAELGHAVVGPHVQLVRMDAVIVDHLVDRLVVPELDAGVRHHVEADHLDGEVPRLVGLEANAVQLAAVPPRIRPGAVVGAAPVVVPVVPDEDLADVALAGSAAHDLVDARGSGFPTRARPERSTRIVTGLRRKTRQVQAIVAVESRELLVAGAQQVQGGVRGHPQVLRDAAVRLKHWLVGGDAYHRRLLDPVGRSVGGARPTWRGCCSPHCPWSRRAEHGRDRGRCRVRRTRIGRPGIRNARVRHDRLPRICSPTLGARGAAERHRQHPLPDVSHDALPHPGCTTPLRGSGQCPDTRSMP